MRDKPCPLETCCSKFQKVEDGSCGAAVEDIFDCFNDVDENLFRLKRLLEVN